ncbi:MAG: TVP38/TMEM64 family protein [Gemmatimonadaceae bacterium]|nr:TVP38/TMEM64 family protein [Gemmatimonadaceae bacterium]
MSGPPPTLARRALPVLLIVAAIVAVVMGGRTLGARLPAFAASIEALGAWGPAAFVLGYALATVCFVPGALLTLAAGALFGLRTGVALVFVGALLGSTAAFLIARYAARRAIESRVARDPRFAAVDRAIARDGRRIVLLLRLSPAFPFSLLNYALGLTRVSLRDYLFASVGMLPGTLLYVYYGKLAGDVATLASGAKTPRDTAYYVVLGVGLAATIAVTALITRTARTALRTATGDVA